MRVLVCGGRDYNNYQKVYAILDQYKETLPITTLIQGGAKGADFAAKLWAKKHNIEVLDFLADWETYGKAAGPIRNSEMLVRGKPDLVIAFPGAKGTANMVSQAREAGVEVVEIKDDVA